MKTNAIRLYGKSDLRMESFELPPIEQNELLVKMVLDSLCMSTYKESKRAYEHKRVPNDIAENPIIVGHEFCAVIEEVGAKWADTYKVGDRIIVQTGMKETFDAIGYSFKNIGGNCTYGILPGFIIENGYVIPYTGEAFYYGALTEPLSCVVGAVNANYHTIPGEYKHIMGPKKKGAMAALASVGPMGLAFLEYVVHSEYSPGLLVVTDIDEGRLQRAKQLISPEEAAKNGVEIHYINTRDLENTVDELKKLNDGNGFDDVFVFAPVKAVVEQADALLGFDGCLNFFAGPADEQFSANFNFYDVHYNSTHIVGTNSGNTDDMKKALDMASNKIINPSILVTHIGGIDSATETILNLPNIPGGKKLVYNEISMPMTAIADFAQLGIKDEFFAKLAEICGRHNGLWNAEAEKYLLEQGKKLEY